MQLIKLLDESSISDKLFFKMKFHGCFISWYWSHTLSIISEGFSALQTSGLFKKQKKSNVSLTTILLPKVNLEHLELLRPWGLRVSSLEAPGLDDSNLNTCSALKPRPQGPPAKNCLDILNKNMRQFGSRMKFNFKTLCYPVFGRNKNTALPSF